MILSRGVSPTLFFIKLVLGTLGPFVLHINFRINLSKILSFSNSDNILIFFFIPEGYFQGVSDIGVRVFFFQHLKILCFFLLPSIVFKDRSAVSIIIFFIQISCHFSLAAFKIIFFDFSFQKTNSDVHWHGFLWVFPA